MMYLKIELDLGFPLVVFASFLSAFFGGLPCSWGKKREILIKWPVC